MTEQLMTTVLQVAATLLITLIGVGGAWLTKKIGEQTTLQNTGLAMEELTAAVQDTVRALNQQLVHAWKNAQGGKLTADQVAALNQKLIDEVQAALSPAARTALGALEYDITKLITDKGDAYLAELKME